MKVMNEIKRRLSNLEKHASTDTKSEDIESEMRQLLESDLSYPEKLVIADKKGWINIIDMIIETCSDKDVNDVNNE